MTDIFDEMLYEIESISDIICLCFLSTEKTYCKLGSNSFNLKIILLENVFGFIPGQILISD